MCAPDRRSVGHPAMQATRATVSGAALLLALGLSVAPAMAGQPVAILDEGVTVTATRKAKADTTRTTKTAATKPAGAATTAKTAKIATTAKATTQTLAGPQGTLRMTTPATKTPSRAKVTTTGVKAPARTKVTTTGVKATVAATAKTSTPVKPPATVATRAATPARGAAVGSKTAATKPATTLVAKIPAARTPTVARTTPAKAAGATQTVATGTPVAGVKIASKRAGQRVAKVAAAGAVTAAAVAPVRRIDGKAGGPSGPDQTTPSKSRSLTAVAKTGATAPKEARASVSKVTAPAAGKSGAPATGGRNNLLAVAVPVEDHVTYQYNALGRRDPYQSLMEGEFVGADVGGDAPPDVGGVKVVGIVWGSDDQFAMAEDARGNSYVLRRGDKVMNGYVEGLRRDAVMVNLTVDGQSQSVAIPITRKGEKANANR